jgi:hypothetical protein
MKTSMYQISIPTFIRVLNNLAAILEKGAAHAEARKIDPTALLNARLYPDMFPFTGKYSSRPTPRTAAPPVWPA